MKLNKIFLILLYIGFFFSSSHSSQENILTNLFNQLEEVNNPKSAALLEEKIWSIWNEHPTNNKLTERLKFGTELMQYGDYTYALKVFDNIIGTDPKWSEAWNRRATLYFLMNQFKNSLNDIDNVLKIEPRHFGALSGQARIFIKLKKYEKAIKSIERTLKFYPSFKSRELIPEIKKLIREESI